METTDWLKHIAPYIRPTYPVKTWPYTSNREFAPGWTEPMRVIYDHELVLFRKGRFVVEIEKKRYTCPADTFIIVPPGKRHITWLTSDRPGHRYWSHFDWLYQGPCDHTPIETYYPAKPRLNAYRWAPGFVPRKILHGQIPVPVRAYELAERLCALQSRANEHERTVSRALLLELLLELLDDRSRAAANSGHRNDIALQIRDLLEQNIDRHGTLRIQDLMEERLGQSYAHLCRVFRGKYGIPPLKYLNAVCVSRAKLLLRDTDIPIVAIAQRLGFHDPLYFSQLFRKISGLSPTQYRRQASA